MDNEKNNQQEVNEEIEITTVDVEDEEVFEGTEDEFDGFDEDFDDVLTDTPKGSFFNELSKQAVSKVLFLIAGIGFFFPFFTVSCTTIPDNVRSFTGVELIFGRLLEFGQDYAFNVPLQMLVAVALGLIALGFLLTLCLKGTARNICGAVFSFAPLAVLTTYYFTLTQALNEAVMPYVISKVNELAQTDQQLTMFMQMQGISPEEVTSPENLKNLFGVDMAALETGLAPGAIFVGGILAVLFIYFVVMLIIGNSKKETYVIDETMDIEFDDFDFESDENQPDDDFVEETETEPNESTEETE